MDSSVEQERTRRYARAFHYAIVDRDVTFQLGDQFGHWYATTGYALYGEDLALAWASWVPLGLPRNDGDH